MPFDPPSSETRMLLQTVETFVREELIPLERPFLRHDFDTLLPLIEEKRQLAKRLGLWLPQIPETYGGMGLSLYDHGLVNELLNYAEVDERRFASWSMGQVNMARLNPALLLKYSERATLDPYAVSGAVSMALFRELVATASIVGQS